MEICCLEECGKNSVRPVLVAPRCNDAQYYPCLPACTKTYYCCDKPKPKHCHRHCKTEYEPCPPPNNHQDCCVVRPPSPRRCCESHECKPTKTKYIMPCYRYEDGRIVNRLPVTAFKRNGMQDQEHSKVQGATNFLRRCPRDVELECDVSPKIKANQPTVLMRRACEVAVGKRPRKRPYEESRCLRDADHQETRYIREDEEGNCCFHFEHQKNHQSVPSTFSQYCMEYPPGMTARPVTFVPAVPQNCYPYSCYNTC